MNNHKIRWEEGTHTEDIILSADEVIKSPGIPENAPIIKSFMKKESLLFRKLNLQEDMPKGKRYVLQAAMEKQQLQT